MDYLNVATLMKLKSNIPECMRALTVEQIVVLRRLRNLTSMWDLRVGPFFCRALTEGEGKGTKRGLLGGVKYYDRLRLGMWGYIFVFLCYVVCGRALTQTKLLRYSP